MKKSLIVSDVYKIDNYSSHMCHVSLVPISLTCVKNYYIVPISLACEDFVPIPPIWE